MTEFHVATALFERIGKYGDRTAIRYLSLIHISEPTRPY